MTFDINQRIAFITGGNRGLGLETARQLGSLGVFIVIGARQADAGREAVALLKAAGVDADSIEFDVGSAIDLATAYAYFEKKAGRLDILINNAGVYLDGEAGIRDFHTAVDIPMSVLRETMDANFFGPIAVTQALLPLLQKSKAGRIVNLSSALGSLTLGSDPASPLYGSNAVAYNSSKTALNSYTLHLAKVLASSHIKVNAAHPGWVQTSMGGPMAPMKLEEGVKTSVMLATLSEDGPTGAFLHMGEAVPW